MRKIQRQVLVSYSYTKRDSVFGFGNTTQFYTDKKRIAPSEIRDMEQIVKKENNFKSVVILNVQFI